MGDVDPLIFTHPSLILKHFPSLAQLTRKVFFIFKQQIFNSL